MSTKIEQIYAILKTKLSEEEAQSIMSELAIASGNGSIAISGDAAGSINISGNQNIVGSNNNANFISFNISSDIDPEKLNEFLKSLQPSESIKDRFDTSTEENEASQELFCQEIENNFYEDYSENRQINPQTIESLKEKDKQRTEPLGEYEILRIAQKIIRNCQEKENIINEYKVFLEQHFSNSNYQIDDETRRQICNRRVVLKLEEETAILLYQETGKELYNRNLLEESISVLTESLGIVQTPESYFSLGLAFYKLGRQDVAIENILQAQSLFNERGQHHEAEEIARFFKKFNIK